jgi:hypothetical protein
MVLIKIRVRAEDLNATLDRMGVPRTAKNRQRLAEMMQESAVATIQSDMAEPNRVFETEEFGE